MADESWSQGPIAASACKSINVCLSLSWRRAGVKLSSSDVYVSTVGGIRLTEPAADLAIALAQVEIMRFGMLFGRVMRIAAMPVATRFAMRRIGMLGRIIAAAGEQKEAADTREQQDQHRQANEKNEL